MDDLVEMYGLKDKERLIIADAQTMTMDFAMWSVLTYCIWRYVRWWYQASGTHLLLGPAEGVIAEATTAAGNAEAAAAAAVATIDKSHHQSEVVAEVGRFAASAVYYASWATVTVSYAKCARDVQGGEAAARAGIALANASTTLANAVMSFVATAASSKTVVSAAGDDEDSSPAMVDDAVCALVAMEEAAAGFAAAASKAAPIDSSSTKTLYAASVSQAG